MTLIMAILVVVNFGRTVPQTVRGRTTFLVVVNPDWRALKGTMMMRRTQWLEGVAEMAPPSHQ